MTLTLTRGELIRSQNYIAGQWSDAADGRAMDELLTPDFVAHGMPPGYAENADGWKQLASDIKNAFPDTQEGSRI